MITPQHELAAKMAAEWWMLRLNPEYYPDHRVALAKAIESRVMREFRGECYWTCDQMRAGPSGREYVVLENDYGPRDILTEALMEVIPDAKPWTLRKMFPIKHSLTVFPDRLEPKEGYGNYMSAIPIPVPEGGKTS